MSAQTLPMPTTFAAAPSIFPRLMVDEPLTLESEIARRTYGQPVTPDVIGELEKACLRGRGGAGFPAHIKWRSVANALGGKVVLANGEEGEPASFKDRWLLTHRPHLVLDGLLLAKRVVGADRAILYLSHPETIEAAHKALAELASAGTCVTGVEIFAVAGTYVAGEESAAVRAVNGGPALPTAKPPRPCEKGVDGLPTLVANVETLAHAAWISHFGAAAYRAYGTEDSPGTTLITLGGNCRRPGVYEIPFGLTVSEVIDGLGQGLREPASGLVMGGWFGGVLPFETASSLTCEFGACKQAGTGWGCGAITVLDAHNDPLAFSARLGRWYVSESARQCGVCIKGTAAIADALDKLERGEASQAELDNLLRWGTTFPGRGACAFLDGAAALSRSIVTHFPDQLHQRFAAVSRTTVS